MKYFFSEQKEKISRFLKSFLDQSRKRLALLHLDGIDVLSRIYEFSRLGKMIRGGLVSLSCMMFKTDISPALEEEIVKIGAALELLQSSLLIHDDIMDRDMKRRGKPSFHYIYYEEAGRKSLRDPYHIGEALGICGGDISFFLAFDLLNSLRIDREAGKEILRLCSREMFYVGVAQMLDVAWGAEESMIDEDSILNLYVYKTGRYTYTLPLKIGAILGRVGEGDLEVIAEIGELMGTVFQIVDDDIGLFGNEDAVGKSIGSDLKEGKKTLYLCKAYNKAGEKERKRIMSCIGRDDIGKEDIEYIRKLVTGLGIRDELSRMIDSMTEKVSALLESLPVASVAAGKLFREFIDYNAHRSI
ncbi:MAG: polyprenyl synthetase family protein [Spirochaetales bacterium]|nr:polyprenyl synthetase family protein [Spirochaetales bacterium]